MMSTQPTQAAQRFADRARSLGITPDIRRFPEGTRTAREAASAIGCNLAQIVKSLVFMADGEPFIVLTAGDRRVDEAQLAHDIGVAELRKATADEVRSATGFAIGGTPPFGHDRPVRVAVDPALMAHRVVWAAAGGPAEVFGLQPDVLVATADASTLADECFGAIPQ